MRARELLLTDSGWFMHYGKFTARFQPMICATSRVSMYREGYVTQDATCSGPYPAISEAGADARGLSLEVLGINHWFLKLPICVSSEH